MAPLPEILLDVARNPFLAVGLPIGMGGLIGYATDTKSTWYRSLNQPPGSPPDWAFGPVWTVLYGAMGYASHLAVRALDSSLTVTAASDAMTTLQLYYTQLALNFAWMPLFFTAKKPMLALADILALGATVWNMSSAMTRLPDDLNGRLLITPYLAWLGYATYLNAGQVYCNWNRTEVGKRM